MRSTWVAAAPRAGTRGRYTVLLIGSSFTSRAALRPGLSFVAAPSTPDEFAALIKSDGERYRRIIREASVRLE